MSRIIGLILLMAACSFAIAQEKAPAEPRFAPQTIDDAIAIGYGVAVGDVDGDERPDILLADAKQIVWYRNPGPPEDGARRPWAKYIMAENLTERDNVCIAARDLDGDGKVEVAVGANWNPGETSDRAKSGSVHILLRPDDPTQKWEAITLEHDPTVHRMRWARIGEDGAFKLCVLPLHGVGNKGGEGETVKLLMYDVPEGEAQRDAAAWKLTRVDTGLHMTHNLEVVPPFNDSYTGEQLLIGGREGVSRIVRGEAKIHLTRAVESLKNEGPGEVRFGLPFPVPYTIATIEPMHGNRVVAYIPLLGADPFVRVVLDDTLNQGHALGCADFLDLGRDQIVAGWRNRNAEGKVGIRMYVPQDENGEKWATHTLTNDIACEDLAVADLDGDGKPDIVAAGRATRNVMILWNEN